MPAIFVSDLQKMGDINGRIAEEMGKVVQWKRQCSIKQPIMFDTFPSCRTSILLIQLDLSAPASSQVWLTFEAHAVDKMKLKIASSLQDP